MTNDVIKRSALNETLKAEWDGIRKSLKACSERRNKVAHGIVYWAPYEALVGDNEMFVGDNLDNPKHAGSATRYYFSELERMSLDFDGAHSALHAFFLKLRFP